MEIFSLIVILLVTATLSVAAILGLGTLWLTVVKRLFSRMTARGELVEATRR